MTLSYTSLTFSKTLTSLLCGKKKTLLNCDTHLCEGPERLKTPGHRAGEAPLAAEGREHEAVLRPVRLVGAVRAAKLLNGLVCAPGQLVREVHPLPLVLRPPVDR